MELSFLRHQRAGIAVIACAVAVVACTGESSEARRQGATSTGGDTNGADDSRPARAINGSADAGSVDDAGAPVDGGVASDSGNAGDAGIATEAGTASDADIASDAGNSTDATDAGASTPSCPNGGLPLCIVSNIDLSEGGPRPSDQCAPLIEVTFDVGQTSFTWASPSGQLVSRVLVKSGTTTSARSYTPSVSEDAVPLVSPTGNRLTRITFCAP